MKLNCLSTVPVKKENQSGGPQFTLTAPQRLRGILILVLTNALSFSGLTLCGQLQLYFFSFCSLIKQFKPDGLTFTNTVISHEKADG